jgi:hypothetical protein
METGLPISFLEGYSVSDLAQVRNDKTGRIIKCYPYKGYVFCKLTYKSQCVQYSLHRLVMLVFEPIENSELYEVDHLDWDTLNNVRYNLRWLTIEEHRLRKRLISSAESFRVYCDLVMKHGEDWVLSQLRACQER